jgi:hypothetical protein
MYRPAVSPHDPRIVFVHCDMTGNYLSKDAGRTWAMFNFNGGMAHAFTFCPVDPNVMYAGVSAGTGGLYKSTDGGDSFRLVWPDPHTTTITYASDHATLRLSAPGYTGSAIHKIAVDPADNQILYAITGSGLQVSRDGGRTFTLTSVRFEADRYGNDYKITVDPASPPNARVLYFSQHERPPHTGIGAVGRIDTANWTRTYFDTAAHDADWIHNANGSTTFFLNKTDANAPAPFQRNIFEVTIASHTATAFGTLTPLITAQPTGLSAYPAGFNMFPIYVGASNANIVYVPVRMQNTAGGGYDSNFGTIKGTRTADGWAWTWNYLVMGTAVVAGNYTHGWIENNMGFGWPEHSWGFAVGKTSRVAGVDPTLFAYSTNMGGVDATRDGGLTWEATYAEHLGFGDATRPNPVFKSTTKGMNITTVYQVVADPFIENHIILSCTDIGQFHSWDGGLTWEQFRRADLPGWRNTNYWTVFDPDVPGRVWSAWGSRHDMPKLKVMPPRQNFTALQGGVAISNDHGRTWQKQTGMGSSGFPENITTHLILDPNSPVDNRILYAATMGRGVYKSYNGGLTWLRRNVGLEPANDGLATGGGAVDTNGHDFLFAWELMLVPNQLGDGRDALYVTMARSGAEGGREGAGGLYVSYDGAATWEKLPMPGLPNNVTWRGHTNFINGLSFDPNNPLTIYAACWQDSSGIVSGTDYRNPRSGGVFRSDDGGRTWIYLWGGDLHIWDVHVDAHNSNVVYATSFQGHLMVSENRGETWRRIEGYNFYWTQRIFNDPYREGYLYMTRFGGGVWHGPVR